MGKFKSRGAYVVFDIRRNCEVAKATTLRAAKTEAQTSAFGNRAKRLKWLQSFTDEHGVTTWISDGDLEIRLGSVESC